MASELEQRVWKALSGVKFPGMSRDIVSFGFVDGVEVADGRVRIGLTLATHQPDKAAEIKRDVERAVGALSGASEVEVGLRVAAPSAPAQEAVAQSPDLIPEVEHVVAVASGKGGVGKSTVAVNLAARMAQLGYRTGLLDADIYGPSIPMMTGIHERPRVEDDRLVPFDKYGLKIMSLGFILETDTAVIWRGPMVMKAIEQMLGDVQWGPLDYMIVDLPPGTGDAQLTISQRVPLAGAVIVTTPQDISLIDARKGLAMFRKVNVPVLGIVENMSSFVCPHCGESTDIFKRGGGESTAGLLEVPFLGRVPLDPAFVEGGDSGRPVVVADPDGPHAAAFEKVARAVVAEASSRPKSKISIF